MRHFTLKLVCPSLLIFLLFFGCSTPQKIDFDRTENSHINKIALLRVDEPKKIRITGGSGKAPHAAYWACCLLGGPCLGAPLGAALGSAAAAGIESGQSKEFYEELNNHHIQFAPHMVEALEQKLTMGGREIIYLPDQATMLEKEDKTAYYAQIDTDADAIMTFMMGSVGYSLIVNAFKPNLWVSTNIFDLRSKKEIYSRTFLVTSIISGVSYPKSIEIIYPGDQYRYDSVDSIMKNVDEAAEGIKACQNKIATRVAEHLR